MNTVELIQTSEFIIGAVDKTGISLGVWATLEKKYEMMSHKCHSNYKGWSGTPNINHKLALAPPHTQRTRLLGAIPPVDLHWFFEISIRTEKKFQLELKKKIQL